MPAIYRNGEMYGSNTSIDDTKTSGESTWSSERIDNTINELTLKKTRMTFNLSNYTKIRTFYAIPISGQYLFATLADFASGNLNTSPFTISYMSGSLYIIVGTVEPTSVMVDFWGY